MALRHITTDDGLSHNNVLAITRDTQGFMWFATADGLTRFDGKRCTIFRPVEGDSNSLPSNHINGFTFDPLGRMWVATGQGLCRWDYKNRFFHRIPVQPPGSRQSVNVPPFFFDKKGYSWSTGDSFLIRFDYRTEQLEFYPTPYGLRGASFTYVDSKDRIWMNVNGSAFRFYPDEKRFEFVFGRRDPNPEKAKIAAGVLGEDQHGRLWSSSWGNGMFVFNEQTGRFEDFDDGPAITTSHLFDYHPVIGPIIWCGGGVYGLYWLKLRDKKSIEFPRQAKEPFSHNNTLVNTFYKDPETNIVWMGTLAGVEKYDPNDLKFTRIMLPDSICPDQFSSICGMVQDAKDPDRYWIPIWGKGMVEWQRREDHFRHYSKLKRTPGLLSDEIFDIAQDKNGRIWLAEYRGVQEFDPETKRFRTFIPPFPTPGINHKVLKIMVARDGRIWMATNYEGLYWLDPVSGSIGHVQLDGKKHYFLALEEDHLGRILVGAGEGFFRYYPDTDRYEHLLQTDSITYTCNDFAFDRQNRLWIATHEGLIRIDNNGQIEFRLSTHNGLANKAVYTLKIDLEDRIWLATGNGLHRFYSPTGRIDVYRRPDGLLDNEIITAFDILPGGELFVGFQDAFNLANASRLPMNPWAPRVALTDVLVLNKPVRWRIGEPIVLHPGDNVVAFDFAALGYTQPEKTVLSYKLEGFDKNWAETKQNTITYTNLDGGTYTLLVRARNGDGIWSQEITRVELRVIPPFTRTVWFRLLLLAVVAGAIGAISWYRQRQRRQLEAIRRRIARDLHDDMGSTVSSIRFFSEVVQSQLTEDQAATRGLVQRIGQSAATLSEAIQDIVWAINARHDNLDDLTARMREFGLRISEARGIRFIANVPGTLPDLHLRPDTRRNVYLIFKEAVNNAAKYSGCTEINASLHLNRRYLTLDIRDNGKGFDPETVQYGNGIANMRQRAEEIRAALEVQTGPEKGVRILLQVAV